MTESKRRYAVVGKPVAHSLSPLIHTLFAQQLGLPVEYGKLEPDEDDFETAAAAFFTKGGSGLNVTLPYKTRAFALASAASQGSRLARTANTLKKDADGNISACNTDGPGLVKDITKRHKVEIKGKRVLVIGAGGGASGIVFSLLAQAPATVCVANRTLGRAEKLMGLMEEEANRFKVEVGVVPLDKINGTKPFDIVVNTTSAGHSGDAPGLDEKMLAGAGLAYDLSYGKAAKPFLEQADSAGVKTICDGLGMLVEQAALSFAYWEGIMPETDSVLGEISAS